jgi:branched-chain amino acid transport system substrate-binding protein
VKETERNRHQGRQSGCNAGDCIRPDQAAAEGWQGIQYQGQTGIGPFNKNNDPSSANIGVYTFDKDNKPVFDHTQSGDVPTD